MIQTIWIWFIIVLAMSVAFIVGMKLQRYFSDKRRQEELARIRQGLLAVYNSMVDEGSNDLWLYARRIFSYIPFTYKVYPPGEWPDPPPDHPKAWESKDGQDFLFGKPVKYCDFGDIKK